MKILRPILIVFTAILALAILNMQTSTSGVFFGPLLDEFGLSRQTMVSVPLFVSLPFLLVAGIVYDWRGGRLVIIVGSIVAALASFGISRTNSPSQFMVLYSFFSVGGALFGGIVPLLMLANWFVRLRGIFIGVVISVASIGTVVAPPLAANLISNLGWRIPYLILGFLPLVLVPLALIIKRRPEDDDSVPDFGIISDRATLLGQWSPLAARRYHPAYDAQGLMLGLKAYSLSFGKNGAMLGILAGFLLVAITFIAYASKVGMSTHLVPHLVGYGVRVAVAARSLAAMTMIVPAGALVLGVLSDFIHSRICLAASLAILGVGILMFVADLHSLAPPLVMGFGQGGLICLVTVVLADYFGRGVLGTLRGILGMLVAIAGLIGGLFLGYVFDATGGYSTGFVGMGRVVLLCAALAIFMWPPRYEKLPTS